LLFGTCLTGVQFDYYFIISNRQNTRMNKTPTAQAPFRLGELLVKEGYLTPDALSKVIELQKQHKQGTSASYKPFGQICVELKLITADELQRILRKHSKRILLGELMINMRLVRPAQVEAALQQQSREPNKKIGQLLVGIKALSEAQLVDALSIQLDVPRILPSLELIDLNLLKKLDLALLKRHHFLPVHLKNDQLTVVMENPQDEKLVQQLEKQFKCRVLPAIATASALEATLEAYLQAQDATQKPKDLAPDIYAKPISMTLPEDDKSNYEPSPLAAISLYAEEETDSDSPQQTLTVGGVSLYVSEEQRKQEETIVNFLFKNALKDRASDIHIEPQEKYLRIRYRIDGVLYHKTDLPQDLAGPMLSRLKQLSDLNPENTLGHQRNRVQATLMDRQLELGVATYPSLWGETMVLNLHERQGNAQELLLNLERTGFSPLCLQRYQKLLNQPGGLIILTGPARSGKTSTLYASINYLNQQNRSIITAENPIEMTVPGTVQGQWTTQRGDTFAEMIRSMSFLDPDILMVSQLESPDILEAASELALTGAKVITTYPAFDATGALLRLINQGLESYLIASSQVAVLSQRLVRRLCSACKRPEAPSRELLDLLGLVSVKPETYMLYQPVGCADCHQHGYKGQTTIHELLVLNEAIREAILDRKPAATIRGIARTEAKLVSMAEDGYFKATLGLTSLNEVQRVAFVNEYDSQTPWEAEEIHAICQGQESEFI
jgi:type IV pilus assembly protein PilB